jgi:hypothetical protein
MSRLEKNVVSAQPEPHPAMRATQVLLKGRNGRELLLPRCAWEALTAAFSTPFPKVSEIGSGPFPVGAALAMFAFLRSDWEELTPLAAAWPGVFTGPGLRELRSFLRHCGGFAVLDPDQEALRDFPAS